MLTQFFRFDNLSNFVGIFVAVFSALIIVYSLGSMRKREGLFRYYSYIILTLIASLGVVFANHLILLMVFWGVLGLLLYLLISFGQKANTSATAKKAFIIIGGSDALMLLGLALVGWISGTLKMDSISISLNSKPAIWAYLCFAAGVFAKAGLMPLHTWVPDTAEDAPTPVTAYLPASLDKLLGIYLLARISQELFEMNAAMNTLLMGVGSFTIVAAAMMAVVQYDAKRLLGYLAVSSAGYMALGLGTGNSVGIAGGLFYMLNSAICMSCLFMSCGGVEKAAGTTVLDKLGGFAKIMPVSFITFLIAGLAISGVPPFNGFASKWMVYQGVIESAKAGGGLWIIWLVAAIFGSVLTLAAFMKAGHALFLGQPSYERRTTNESGAKRSLPEGDERRTVGLTVLIPQVFLAALCVIFGIFAYQIPLKLFIFPSIGQDVAFSGIWNANMATALLFAGIIIGIIIYLLGTVGEAKEAEIFVGGETLKEEPRMRVSGVGFYNTIQEIPFLKSIYRQAFKKVFDPYHIGRKITFGFTGVLRYFHNGVLPTYLAWCLLGTGILLYILLR